MFGFWKWFTYNTETIYLSFPIFAYLPTTLLIKFFGADSIYFSREILTYSQIGITGTLLYLLLNTSRAKDIQTSLSTTGSLGIGPSILLITNPAILSILVEPVWDEFFITTSLLGLLLIYNSRFKILGEGILTFAFINYFPGALAYIAAKFLSFLRKGRYLLSRNITLKDIFVFISSNLKTQLKTTSILRSAYLGIGIYTIWRLITYFILNMNEIPVGGSSLITRIGIDPNDDFYGGVINFARVLIPIPNKDYFQNFNSDLSSAWKLLNLFTIIIEYLTLTSIGILYGLKLLNKRPNDKATFLKDIPLKVLTFYGVISLFQMILLPQMATVHFRTTARILSPFISISLATFVLNVTKRFISNKNNAYAVYISILWLITIDQIRIFMTLYL
ncbi:hypothetical protein [Prochlorococcus sp. MIT 1223]|uniref:hypothetical protein n=1 Tax=Prochlorococcus sp. MIT 1223 TaxID=3096217 RepID=UPI002A761B4D|nr:hypothetical protein [Prochlorococcus sp. MIT 1223]